MSSATIRVRNTAIANRFILDWREIKEQLVLDFNPIIKTFHLEGNYLLLHWQARPKGARTWGFYDSQTASYYSPSQQEKIAILLEISPVLLQIDETIYQTVPTAVILFPDITFADINV